MSFQTLGIPASSFTVTVKAFSLVDDPGAIGAPASLFLAPVLAGHERLRSPVFAFLIEDAATKQRVMFDLGMRKDIENTAPFVAQRFKAAGFTTPVKRDIVEQLADTGVELDTISAVIWSHAHFDHTGDMSKFPPSTDLVFGEEMVRDTSDPNTHLLENDFAGRKLVPVNFDNCQLEFSGFKAHDFFGDGSLYLLDVPGHLPGHLSALARVTPTTFIFLGGDTCHHAGLFRPTDKLHRHFPCPGETLASAGRSVSAQHFPPVDASGTFNPAARTTPMFSVAEKGYHADPPTARISISKLGSFDANPDVFVALAHDESLMSVVGPFPAVMNDWKAKGWKELVTWAFLDDKNPAFRFSPKAAV